MPSGRGRRVRAFGAVRARARTSGDFWVVCMASSSNALVSADRTFEEPSREGAAEAPREAMAAMVDGRCAEGAFRVPARDRACDASGGRGGILSGASAIGPRRIGTSPRERRAATRGARSGAARRARFFTPSRNPRVRGRVRSSRYAPGPEARDGRVVDARERAIASVARRAGTYGRLGGDRKASPGALRSARAGARARGGGAGKHVGRARPSRFFASRSERAAFPFDAAGHSPDPASDPRTVERRFARKRGSGETRRKGSAFRSSARKSTLRAAKKVRANPLSRSIAAAVERNDRFLTANFASRSSRGEFWIK